MKRLANRTTQVKFYSQECLSIMNAIEDKLQSEFEAVNPQLEKSYQNAKDFMNVKELRRIHKRLKEINELINFDCNGNLIQ